MFPRALFTANPYSRATPVYGSAATQYLPDLLPTTGLLALWYAGAGDGALSYVTTDGDGQPASAWPDTVASVSPANTGGNRPTYRQSVAAFNNRGAVQFVAASSQYLLLSVASGIVANLNTYSLYIVFSASGTAAGHMYGESRSSSTNPLVAAVVNQTAAGRIRSFHRSDAATAGVTADISSGSGFNDGAMHILTMRRSASNAFTLYGDGTSLGTSSNTPVTTTIDRLAFGRYNPGAGGFAYFNGYLAAIIAYSTDNRGDVEPILNEHY